MAGGGREAAIHSFGLCRVDPLTNCGYLAPTDRSSGSQRFVGFCMAKRPSQLPPRRPLTPTLIDNATYVGSAEHKQHRWWGGLPAGYVGPSGRATRPKKQLTTICSRTSEADRVMASGWVKAALRLGQLRYYEADQDFPKRIWYRDDSGQLWFGFCVNSVQGQYKGWPIEEDERVAVFG
jgi:hypothetical protein